MRTVGKIHATHLLLILCETGLLATGLAGVIGTGGAKGWKFQPSN